MSVSTSVVLGNVTDIPADGLVTAINSEGMWYGAIDRVIQRVAGGQFHKQAADKMPLADGQTVVASGDKDGERKFRNVVFVVDDLEKKLSDVVCAGLTAASNAGFKKVSLPTMRMGVMLGAVEKTVDEVASEMAKGVQKFTERNPKTPVEDITFVVYNDKGVKEVVMVQ